ncbi:hypothetical protein OG266_39505 [Streptomyces sp. NBC_00554]|uniref:hypothetical protein n=1 Tax=Streptomyces sp. NBC_00554 TaxID=2903661 RepID=UPI00352D5F40|nr:hypothetical protein OG266_39505 [Streptomyces sp. NBC_00554]
MKRTTLSRQTASRPAIAAAALAPTGRPHPLLVADAVAQTSKAAEESADRYIAEQHPRVSELLADDGAREHVDPEQPLTAAQRTPVLDYGLGGWRTAPVETEQRDIDDQRTAAENSKTPFLAAEMVVTDYRPQAYGRQTEIWLSYGITTGSITPAKAREVLEAMRDDFLPKLEALVALAEETAAGDFEGDPEIARLDRAAEDARIKTINEARA